MAQLPTSVPLSPLSRRVPASTRVWPMKSQERISRMMPEPSFCRMALPVMRASRSRSLPVPLTRWTTLPLSRVKVLPVNNYTSHLTVTADGEGKSKVQWRGAFYRGFPNNDPPPELSDQAAIDAVTGVYKAGLDALKAEMEK